MHGRNFVVHTDHYPLRYLQTQDHLPPRQEGWLERLVEFDFSIVPIREKSNEVADVLSIQSKDSPSTQEYSQNLLKDILEKTFQPNAISTTITGPIIVQKLGKEYAQDPEFQKIYKEVISPFEVEDVILYRDNRLWVPKGEFRSELLHDYHTTPNTGHFGETKTRHRNPTVLQLEKNASDHSRVRKELSYLSANKITESQTIRFSTVLGRS